jgi:hypothetical protein
MLGGIEQQCVLFHDRARNVFFSVYKEFRHSIASVDRQGDENVFQQLQTRYANLLHLQLNKIALELLDQAEPSNRSMLNVSLGQSIKEYVSEFMQKAKSL